METWLYEKMEESNLETSSESFATFEKQDHKNNASKQRTNIKGQEHRNGKDQLISIRVEHYSSVESGHNFHGQYCGSLNFGHDGMVEGNGILSCALHGPSTIGTSWTSINSGQEVLVHDAMEPYEHFYQCRC